MDLWRPEKDIKCPLSFFLLLSEDELSRWTRSSLFLRYAGGQMPWSASPSRYLGYRRVRLCWETEVFTQWGLLPAEPSLSPGVFEIGISSHENQNRCLNFLHVDSSFRLKLSGFQGGQTRGRKVWGQASELYFCLRVPPTPPCGHTGSILSALFTVADILLCS